MINGALVQLAHPFNPAKHRENVNGWYVSEKLDGQRAIWLPFTRNSPVSEIPFANRERDSRDHVATGLWSRYGKPIFAPDWWLDKLPTCDILDGELYVGRGQFQTTSSYVRKHPAERQDSEWKRVRFMLFDCPDVEQFFLDRRIYSPNYKAVFSNLIPTNEPLRSTFLEGLGLKRHGFRNFEDICTYLSAYDFGHEPVAEWLPQVCLPFHTDRAIAQMEQKLGEVLEVGGEGLILRKYSHLWEPIRSHNLLKVKPTNDDEGTIIGFSLGIGKFHGLIGAMLVAWKGQRFELSGFTDAERVLNNASEWYARYEVKRPILPDEEGPARGVFSPFFKVGERITFTYRELTDSGLPKEARYLRKRPHGE